VKPKKAKRVGGLPEQSAQHDDVESKEVGYFHIARLCIHADDKRNHGNIRLERGF
jgi:hypothetical protein